MWLPSCTSCPEISANCRNWQGKYSKYTEAIPTRAFLTPLDEDEEVEVEISKGNITHIKYRAMGELQPNGTRSDLISLLSQCLSLIVTFNPLPCPSDFPPFPLHLCTLLCLCSCLYVDAPHFQEQGMLPDTIPNRQHHNKCTRRGHKAKHWNLNLLHAVLQGGVL